LGGEGSAVIGRMGPRLALLFACLWWFGQRSSPSEHLFGWIAFARCMNACTCTVSLYEDTCRRSPVASSESYRREPPPSMAGLGDSKHTGLGALQLQPSQGCVGGFVSHNKGDTSRLQSRFEFVESVPKLTVGLELYRTRNVLEQAKI
jgi:hypothetical protein